MDTVKPSLLRALLDKPPRPAAPTSEPDQAEEYEAFAFGRIGRQPQLTLVFRLADGSSRAFAYSYFYGAESDDPNTSILLDFTRVKIRLSGRNLGELFRAICRHRVAEIHEAGRSQSFEVATGATIVEKIEIQKLTG